VARAESSLQAEAFAHCAKLVKKSAKNFYYAFAILPREKRDAMYAVYAFCREADDAVDEGGTDAEKAARLDAVRRALDRVYEGKPEGPALTALAEVVSRYGLQKKHLADVVDGCEMDLRRTRYETFDDLAQYLDRVASAVGRVTMQIFGLDPTLYADYAVAGGYAVQLTNILRDVKEDFERGRVYLPQEDLKRFEVPESDLGAAKPSRRFRELMRFEVARNRAYYDRSRTAIGDRERRILLPLEAIVRIYSRLLDAIERRGYDVLGARVAIPGWRKAMLGFGTWARARLRLPLGS
jgi:phytoene synthase